MQSAYEDSVLGTDRYQAIVNRIACQASHVVQVELAHQVCAMVFGGFDADFEPCSDIPRTMTFGDQLENFSFSLSQNIDA